MARPKKNNADYFSHDANMRNGLKIKALRNKFGITGYAIWCMLLECLTGSDENYMPDDEIQFELLAGDFGVSYEALTAIIDYCVKLELLSRSEDKIRSKSLDERLAPLYESRKQKQEFMKQLREKKAVVPGNNDINAKVVPGNNSNEPVLLPETIPQSKVKESKDNSKELLKKKDAARAATIIRREEFLNSLNEYREKYPSEMIDRFFDYWSEMNRSQTKMLFEMKETWELAGRLRTWAGKERPNQNSHPATERLNNKRYEQF